MSNPNLFIIAGCNGAGKTTASLTVLPEFLNCEEFVNADEIAKGLSPFHPEEMAVEAGRLMLLRINRLIAEKNSFAIICNRNHIGNPLLRKVDSRGKKFGI